MGCLDGQYTILRFCTRSPSSAVPSGCLTYFSLQHSINKSRKKGLNRNTPFPQLLMAYSNKNIGSKSIPLQEIPVKVIFFDLKGIQVYTDSHS